MRGREVRKSTHNVKCKEAISEDQMLLLYLKSPSKFVAVCRSGYANKAESKAVTT